MLGDEFQQSELAPLAAVSGVSLISLQKGARCRATRRIAVPRRNDAEPAQLMGWTITSRAPVVTRVGLSRV
jgi:hypothetical protein